VIWWISAKPPQADEERIRNFIDDAEAEEYGEIYFSAWFYPEDD
jgi:hypothetical protein